MDTLLAEYMTRFTTSKADAKTRRNAAQAFSHFQRFLDASGIDAHSATDDDVAAFVIEMQATLKDSTVKLYLGQVRAAYKKAVMRGRIDRNPTTDVALPRVVDPAPRVFAVEELDAIRESIENTREAIVFYGLAYTGLRNAELRTLALGDVDFRNAQLTVTGKYGKQRYVPLHPKLTDVLGPHFARGHAFALPNAAGDAPISPSTFDRTLDGLLARAAIDGSAPDFRKTVTTILAEQGVREAVIDKILGWAPSTVRDRYYTRIADKDMHAAILHLYPTVKKRRQRPARTVTARPTIPTLTPEAYPPLRLVRSV